MASSNTIPLANASVEPSTYYLIDANVWIYALQGYDLLEYWWQKKYVDFFYQIIESELKPKPKILLPTLLFSEILNTYLKGIAYKEYQALIKQEIQYKRDYRPTQHHKESYEKVCDDISGVRNSIHFISDQSFISNPSLLINYDISNLDFSDYFYYQLCKEFQKENKVYLVTADGDFDIQDIKIITANPNLLRSTNH